MRVLHSAGQRKRCFRRRTGLWAIRIFGPCAALLLVLLLGLASLWPHSSAKAQSGPDEAPTADQSPSAPSAPFLTIVPSEDGRELLIRAETRGEVVGGLYTRIGIGETGIKEGWTGIKEGWTMTYSETAQSYVTTAVGLAPELSLEGRIAVTSSVGLTSEPVDFVRAYVPNDGPQTIRAASGALEIQLPAAGTLPAAAYVAVVPSYTPPGEADAGQQVVGPVYSIRAAGALAQSRKPFLLRLYYTDALLAGRDVESLVIAFWNGATQRWQPLDSRAFAQQRYLSVATDQFGTYALLRAEAESAPARGQGGLPSQWLRWLEALFNSIDEEEVR